MDFESAYREIFRSTSNLRFVQVLKVAILGELGLGEQAAPIIETLLESNPDIKATFYPWLENLGWAKPLVQALAESLTKAGLVVDELSTK
ncbi:hypothetical protein [Martelella soudanensis]|uniref:hypothetical protein n=1 Tax=unclassified Martelella TaxID=2629616 RepID=UPI0015DF1D80|nr:MULTISPECIES: hypothetical protein [unclassified Martelella]